MRKKLAVCASVCVLALAGCASSPVSCESPAVVGPQIQAPAAWAMQPSNSTVRLQAVFSIFESPSSSTLKSSTISSGTLRPATKLGLKPPSEP